MPFYLAGGGAASPTPSVHQWIQIATAELGADATTLIDNTFAPTVDMDLYSYIIIEFDLQLNAISELRLQVNGDVSANYEGDGYRATGAVITGLADNALAHFLIASTTLGQIGDVKGIIVLQLSNTVGGTDRSYIVAHWEIYGGSIQVKEQKSGALFVTKANISRVNLFSSVANSIRNGSRATIYKVSRTNYAGAPP